MAAWERVSAGLDYGGYVAWEAAVSEAQGDGGRDHVPVFLVLQPPAGSAMTLAEAIDATLALPDVRFSQHERDLLATERALAGTGWPHEVRVVLFCPRAMLADCPAFWRVLQVGPGLAMPNASASARGQEPLHPEGRS